MKKLSIEQKAKLYDEAYKKVAVRFGSNVADEIFLKESEDERIRKWSITYFREVCDNVAAKEKNAVLAWLEKQGEHAKFLNSIQVGDKVTRNQDGVLVNLSQLKRVAKPAEKFPKYEKGDILTDGKNKYEVLSWDYTETGIAAYYMKGAGCKFSWNCEEVDKKLHLVEQKPADTEKGAKGNEREIPNSAWSEDDEMFVHGLIRGLAAKRDIHHHTTFSSDNIDITETIKWLKSLKDRIQSKQEWGEEDETKLKSACALIRNTSLNGNEDVIDSTITFLKSLKERYTWKPSEEQMDAVRLAAEIGTANNSWAMGILKSMYQDLKKLK